MNSLSSSLALAVILNGCVCAPLFALQEQATSPQFDPTGTYHIVVYYQTGTARGEMHSEMTVSRTDSGGYTGDWNGAAMANIAVEGQTMTFIWTRHEWSVEVEFEGEEFKGIVSGEDSFVGKTTITGVKISGGALDIRMSHRISM